MYPECRHIKPSGAKCQAPALKGTSFCYFHTRLHALGKRPPDDPRLAFEIPALEDRASIQFTITQVLRRFAAGALDRQNAYILLYGLQLASQNVDRTPLAIPSDTVESVDGKEDGEELGPERINLGLAFRPLQPEAAQPALGPGTVSNGQTP